MKENSKKRQTFIYRALSTEVEVYLTPFSTSKDCVSVVWVCTSCKFNQSGQKKLIVLFLMKKSEFCEIFSRDL